MSKLVERAKQVAAAAGTAAAVASVLGVRLTGRPIKDKDKPAAFDMLGLRWFERDHDGKQYVLWWRIRDVRR